MQDGRLYLIITHEGQMVRRMMVDSGGRLDDGQAHRVIVRRLGRHVSNILRHFLAVSVCRLGHYKNFD